MKLDTLKNELKNDGYSKEEQYFYELNLDLIKNAAKAQMSESTHKAVPLKSSHQPVSNADRIKERSIQRWESDGGSIDKSETR